MIKVIPVRTSSGQPQFIRTLFFCSRWFLFDENPAQLAAFSCLLPFMPFSLFLASMPEPHKAPARTSRLRQTVSLNGISVCCLRMRFDDAEQLVNATRNLREQIRRV